MYFRKFGPMNMVQTRGMDKAVATLVDLGQDLA